MDAARGFGRFAEDLAHRLPRRPPGDVLELACGTGIVTARLRQRLHPAVRLVATDLSAAMLDYARSHVGGDIDWRIANAMDLPFPDGEFAAVVCAFGVMFVPDKARAFSEARRVLRTGGALCFNVWDGLANNPHGAAADEVLNEMFPNDPAVGAGALPYQFNERTRIAAMLSQAAFTETRMEVVRIQCSAPSAREFATGQLRGSPRGNLIEQRAASVEAAIDRLADKLARLGGTAPFNYTAQALLVQARAG